MVKLCLGTANFGSKYGLSKNKIANNELLKIMHLANKNDLFNIDTSFEYFNSHQKLREIIKKKTNITTKIFLDKKSSFISIKKKYLILIKTHQQKLIVYCYIIKMMLYTQKKLN